MINTKKTVIASAVVLLVLIVGGVTGFVIGKNTLDEKEAEFRVSMNEIQKKLPVGVTQELTLEKGLFESHGIYKISYTTKENKNDITINYKIKHGLISYFDGKTELEAVGKLNGDVTKNVKLKEELFKTSGILYKNGDMDLKNEIAEVNIVPDIISNKETTKNITQLDKNQSTNQNMPKIDPSSSILVQKSLTFTPSINHFNYKAETRQISSDWNLPLITLSTKDYLNNIRKIEIQNVLLKRVFNKTESSLGNTLITVGSIKSPFVVVSNLNADTLVSLENNKYNLITKIKINELKTLISRVPVKNIEYNYSLKGVDKKSLDNLIINYQTSKTKENITDEDKTLIKNSIIDIIKNGFSFNIDNLKYNQLNDVMNMSANLNIKPTLVNEKVSINKQANMNMKLNLIGSTAYMLSYQLNTFGVLIPNNNLNTPPQKAVLDLYANYENKVLKINNTVIETNYLTTSLDKFLTDIDEKLGLQETTIPQNNLDITNSIPLNNLAQ